MKMKLSILILFMVLSTSVLYAQNSFVSFMQRNNYAVYLGFNGTRPEFDDNWKPSNNFLAGGNIAFPLNEKFTSCLGFQYATRGGDDYQATRDKYRSRYIDSYLSLSFQANRNISFLTGLQYAYNVKNIRKRYNDFLDEYHTEVITGKNYSQAELFLGVNVSVTDKVCLNFKYVLPNHNLYYSNYQFTVGYYIFSSKKKQKKQYEFKNYNNPLSVRKIRINETDLTEIPWQIFEMANLRELVIIKSDIRYIPSEIGRLTKLEKLSFQFNDIDSISPEIGQLKRLKSLNLQFNNLTMLPSTIGNLENLELLYLQQNKLKELPAEIGNLRQLRFLYIGKNNLAELPEEMAQLENLIELDIYKSGTMLKIPDNLNELRKLEYLYIDKTTILPYSILNFNSRLKIIQKSNSNTDLRN